MRFWDDEKKCVTSRFFNSAFMGHSTTECILASFKEAIQEILMKLIMQVRMYGPSVNWKFLDLLEQEIVDGKLIEVDSCGLHSVHRAFQTGHKVSGWNINRYLRSMYNLLKDSLAQRADYSHLSATALFPRKFCQIRWVENRSVVDWALEVLSYVESMLRV